MTIRITVDGIPIECDTALEALEVRRLLAAELAKRPQVPTEQDSASQPHQRQSAGAVSEKKNTRTDNPAGFIASLNPNGKKLVSALAEVYPEALPTEDWAVRAGLKPAMLGPLFKHIYSVADRSGLSKEDTFERVQSQDDPAWKRRYRLGKKIIDAAKAVFG